MPLAPRCAALQEARDRWGQAEPYMFCTMAHAFGRRRQLDRVEATLADAAARHCVSLPLLNACMHAYGQAGLLQHMTSCFARIHSFGFVPDSTRWAGSCSFLPSPMDPLCCFSHAHSS